MKVFELKQVIKDGKPVKQLRCVTCGKWGDIDDDQYNGKFPTTCIGCGHTELHNYAERF